MRPMVLLHEELRRAREKAGLSQQALADLAGIPRNQVVRAERGENITIETLRRIAAHLPVAELPLLDTTGLRVDVIGAPDKLVLSAVENVMRLAEALRGAIQLAADAYRALDVAQRAATPPGEEERRAEVVPLFLIRRLEQLAGDIDAIEKDAKIAS